MRAKELKAGSDTAGSACQRSKTAPFLLDDCAPASIMARSIKSILNAVVVIVVVVWLLNVFGLLNSIQNFRIGRG